MNLDENGLICFRRPDGYLDGGDSAQRAGFYCAGKYLQGSANSGVQDFVRMADKLIIDGKLVRNPRPGDSDPPWNDPKDCSRDQYRPMIIAAGFYGLKDIVNVLVSNIKCMTFPNWDICGPDNLNEIQRALKCDPSVVGDTYLSFGVAIRIRKASRDPDDVGDDLNLLLTLAQAHYIKPNGMSEENLVKYLKFRPTNLGCERLGEKDPVMGAISWYFRRDDHGDGNPEIAEAWRPVVHELRKETGTEI